MELVSLNEENRVDKLIENYDSLIWTERYFEPGDFELVTGNIEETLKALPRDSLVSLRETLVPMVVENYEITHSTEDGPKLKVTGRSYETVLERRASVNSLPSTYSQVPMWKISANKSSDAAYKMIRQVIGDNSWRSDLPPVSAQDLVSPLDTFLRLSLPLPTDYSPGADYVFDIPKKDLYSATMELLQSNHHGLKASRPKAKDETFIDIEIYNGADLTGSVIFDDVNDVFKESSYLLTDRGSANVAYIFGPEGSAPIHKTAAPPLSLHGMSRRVLVVDESSSAGVNNYDLLRSRALIQLYQHNATALFDGEVAEYLAQEYNVKYRLGDILRLNGKYGLTRNVRVAEFIRSEDSTGRKSYPTLEVVDD